MTPKLVTFDVYMALLDIQGSLTPVLAGALGIDEARAGPLVQLWRAKQMERAAQSNSLGAERTPFRRCTRLGLDYMLARNGFDLPEGARDDLVRAWDTMTPWPEAVELVAEVKRRGYPTAILSNGDQDMLDAVAGLFDDGFDHVLSSETAGFYKPHQAVYALTERVLGIAAGEVLHGAGAPGDVFGAVAAGLPCYWSNRAGDIPTDPAYRPDFEGTDLEGVLALIEAADGVGR